jgi:hypothetical protein
MSSVCFFVKKNIATRKILGFYISAVNSSRRNVLKEVKDCTQTKVFPGFHRQRWDLNPRMETLVD